MWVTPDEPGGPPSYQQRELVLADLAHGWIPIASGRHPDAVVSLGSTGSTLWVSVLPAGASRTLPAGDLLHVYLARGVIDVESIGRLEPGDSLRLSGSAQLRLFAETEAEVLVWQMNSEQGDLA
jgi:quercetin 2,3-dioxygenase